MAAFGIAAIEIRKARNKSAKKGISASTPNLRTENFDHYNNQNIVAHSIKDIRSSLKSIEGEIAGLKEDLKVLRQDVQYTVVKSAKATCGHVLQERSLQDGQINAELHSIKSVLHDYFKTGTVPTGNVSLKPIIKSATVATQTTEEPKNLASGTASCTIYTPRSVISRLDGPAPLIKSMSYSDKFKI